MFSWVASQKHGVQRRYHSVLAQDLILCSAMQLQDQRTCNMTWL